VTPAPKAGNPTAAASHHGERPLDIAFIVPEDRQTGTYFRFHNLAIALVALGQNVTVYSQTNENHLRTTRQVRDGVPYVFCPTVGGNRVVISPVNPGNIARRLITRITPADVYHLFQPYPSGAIPWLAIRARRQGVFAYDWDDYWMNDEFGLKHPRGLNSHITSIWVRFLESYLPSHCDLLTTLSHNIAALAHRLRCARTDIVYNGVWEEEPADRQGARIRLGLKPGAIYAGMMGWSGEADWAMEALDACMHEFPDLRIAWCGKDTTAVVNRFPAARSRVDLLGFLPSSRLADFRSAMDIGLIPMGDTEFNQYRLPYKLTDFLSSGTPVLASDVGETSIVARQLPGVAVCRPTKQAWLKAFRDRIGIHARESHNQRVTTSRLIEMLEWTHVASKLLDAYKKARVSSIAVA